MAERKHAVPVTEGKQTPAGRAVGFLSSLDFEGARDFIRSEATLWSSLTWQAEVNAIDAYLKAEQRGDVAMRHMSGELGMGPELIDSVLSTPVGKAAPRLEALRPVVAITYEQYLNDGGKPVEGYTADRGDGTSQLSSPFGASRTHRDSASHQTEACGTDCL